MRIRSLQWAVPPRGFRSTRKRLASCVPCMGTAHIACRVTSHPLSTPPHERSTGSCTVTS